MDRKAHWEQVYSSKAPEEVSWYQARPEVSLRLIAATGASKEQPIIDVGGGASVLVDRLLDAGYADVSVLDVSSMALEAARSRLGERAAAVTWYAEDVTRFRPAKKFQVWHDRAVFHFLTDPADRQAYVQALEQALTADGQLIIATFGPTGPERCSGLEVVRYSPEALCQVFGRFELVETVEESHLTPAGRSQAFVYCRFSRRR